MDSTAQKLFGSEIGSTTVTTIASRARGAAKYGITDWTDTQAEEVFRALQERAQREGFDLESLCLTSKSAVVGTIRRSQALDQLIRDFAAAHPSPVILSLGIGLCNAASRLRDIDARWFGVDKKEVLDTRAELIPEDTVHCIPGDLAEPHTWLPHIPADAPTLVVAEGVLMYLQPESVPPLLDALRAHFSEAPALELAADLYDTLMMKRKTDHEIKERTGASYSFGAEGPEGLASQAEGWEALGAVDTMSPISTEMRLAVPALKRLCRGRLPYSVMRIAATRA
ncbi:class I SAM-dependent methyltransferase [Corynebacterium uropygiale]|uniref:Class I SAM-dependent methyltransferase n=1 Tax=Corynebacterium uropygiale TaxID=1775911 RepID=A0A9X1QUB7_9CORY|nr:class I SAM-dependent methyltransferase [Corynebacterium uropygiale]MCF4007140.1 class I SAM-dependent methyltransferase [Corynebacterium uropygiale]